MSGILDSADLTSLNTNVLIYEVPSGKTATFSVIVCNRNSVDVKVHLAITSGSTPTNTDWILFNHTIYSADVYKELGVVLGEGQRLYGKTNTSNVNIVAFGFQEDNS